MDEVHIKILNSCRSVIVRDMNVARVLDYLIGIDPPVVLSHHEEEIMKLEDEDRKRRFLAILQQREERDAFKHFLDALKDSQQHELHNIIANKEKEVLGTATSSELRDRELNPATQKLEKMNLIQPRESQINIVQKVLKEMYLQRFKKINPFSLPFTFDIEKTWVSLALRTGRSLATEDHAELLRSAFEKEKMLIIEGRPASGKTSLMRRLAYEWAKGEQKLSHYDVVLYAEFREVREKTFETIADLTIEYHKKYYKFVSSAVLEDLKSLLNDQGEKVLLLLDGYDESIRDKQCKELTTNYFESSTIQSPLFFNIVLTTRPGYLGQHRGNEGRHTFADVLGFITVEQKEKYILNHFSSINTNDTENIPAVHKLLQKNRNMNKLAETPLFLTFICLVHEKIHDGTVLELYCSIIWWLIDRHQKDFPNKDIPSLFDYQGSSNEDKFEIIQEYYHQFPQLHRLGSMALYNLEKDLFSKSEYSQFRLKDIVERVGLLRKERTHKRHKLITSFFFPHRTIKEFLAALYFFCSKEELDVSTNKEAAPNSTLDTNEMKQYQSFLLQIALSDGLPILPAKSKIYFESITDIKTYLTFHAFNTVNGLNSKLLNALFSQCKNARNITVDGSAKYFCTLLIYLNNMLHLHTTIFQQCIFKAGSQLSFKNCPVLKNSKFYKCQLQSSIIDFAELFILDSLKFEDCTFASITQLSFKNCPVLKNSKFYKCQLKSSNVTFAEIPILHHLEFDDCIFACNSEVFFKNCPTLKYLKFYKCQLRSSTIDFAEVLILHHLEFEDCTFASNTQLSFKNWPALKNLEFNNCNIQCGTTINIAQLKDIDVLEFDNCIIDLKAWKSITEEISKSSVKRLNVIFQGKHFKTKYIKQLQICSNVIIHMGVKECISSIEHLKFNGTKLLSFTFWNCTYQSNSQLVLKNFPSLKNLKFSICNIQHGKALGIAKTKTIHTIEFIDCNIDLKTWQSIIEEISKRFVKCLKFSPDLVSKPKYVKFVQDCNNIEEICVEDAVIYKGRSPKVFTDYEHSIIPQLISLAKNMQSLRSIVINFTRRQGTLISCNKELIEKAGQERDPTFLVSIIPYDLSHER